jgi:hypothetical protein
LEKSLSPAKILLTNMDKNYISEVLKIASVLRKE